MFSLLLAFSGINAQQSLTSGGVILNIGHQRPIRKLQFVNQDNYFLSQDECGIVKIWDAASGKELYTLSDSTITLDTEFLPTVQAQILSYSYNGKQYQLNLEVGHELEKDNPVAVDDSRSSIQETISFSYPLYSVELLKDGKVEVWSIDHKQLLQVREFPTHWIRIYSFNQKGNLLLLSDGQKIWLWDWRQDRILYKYTSFLSDLINYQYSPYIMPNGIIHFMHSRGNIVHWVNWNSINLYTGELKYYARENPGVKPVKQGHRVTYSSSSDNNYVSLLDELELPRPYEDEHPREVQLANFSPHVGYIFNAGDYFLYWDVKNEQELYRLKPQGKFFKFYIDDSDQRIALVDLHHINIHDLKSGKLIRRIPYESIDPSKISVQFFPGLKRIAINDQEIQKILIWDIETTRNLGFFEPFFNETEIIGLSDEDQMIYCKSNHIIHVYNFAGKKLYEEVLMDQAVDAHYFPETKKIIAASGTGVIYQFDALTGKLEKQIFLGESDNWIARDQYGNVELSANAMPYLHHRDKTGNIGAIPPGTYTIGTSPPKLLPKPSARGAMLNLDVKPDEEKPHNWMAIVNANWGTDLQMPFVDKTGSGPLISQHARDQHVSHTVFSKDEKLIALQTGTSCKIIERATGRVMRIFYNEKFNNVKPVITANNRFLVWASALNEIKIRDIAGLESDRKLRIEGHEISRLILSNDNSTLLMGTNRGYLLLFNFSDFQKIKELKVASSRIEALTINPDDSKLAVGDNESNIYLLEFKTLQILSSVNRGSKFDIHQLHFHPQKPILLVSTFMHILGLDYSNVNAWKTVFDLGMPSEPEVIFNPGNLDQFTYFKYVLEKEHLFIYDLAQRRNVDSTEQTKYLYQISESGRYRLEASETGIDIVDTQLGQIKPIGDPGGKVQHISLFGDTLCVNTQFSKQFKIFGIGLPHGQILLEAPGFNSHGLLTQEGKRIQAVGLFNGSISGYGKKNVPDSNFTWKVSTPGITNAVLSKNVLYLATYPFPGNDTVYIYSVKAERLLNKVCLLNKDDLKSVAISNSGQLLAYTLPDIRCVFIYDLKKKTTKQISDVKMEELDFSVDDSQLIGTEVSDYNVIDVKTGTFRKHRDEVFQEFWTAIFYLSKNFGIIRTPNERYQLWNLQTGQKLGNFYFYDSPLAIPHWVFVAQDGRYDGNPQSLPFLYDLNVQNLTTQTVNPQTDKRYTPGLLFQLLKE